MDKRQNQLIRDYRAATTAKPSALTVLLVFIGVGIWWGGPFFGLYTYGGSFYMTLVVNLVIAILLPLINVALRDNVDRQFFDNPDNHTHDDNCDTCGNPDLFGYSSSAIRPEQYICRHESGQLRLSIT